MNRCPVCDINHNPRCLNASDLRWPLAPLLDYVPGRSHHRLMARVNASGESVARAARDGLSDRLADNWAIAIGTHPAAVWPTWGLYIHPRQEPHIMTGLRPTETLSTPCWCGAYERRIPSEEVRRGRTWSCGEDGCNRTGELELDVEQAS